MLKRIPFGNKIITPQFGRLLFSAAATVTSSTPTLVSTKLFASSSAPSSFGDNYDFSSTLEESLKQRDERHDKEQQAVHGVDSAQYKLPGEERNRLTRMLYKEFFTQTEGVRAEGDVATKAEIEGMYEARIELNWIVQWAREQSFPTQEKFIRAIQTAVLQRVDLHKPLSFILGTQPFLGCEIKVEAPLLIPRTETEEWVQWWCTKYMAGCADAPLRILDLCCGTGCIGSAVLKQFPNVEVVGVDIEPLAVRTTIDNYRRACEDAIRTRLSRRNMAYNDKVALGETDFKIRVQGLVLKMRSEDRSEDEIKEMKKQETQNFLAKEKADALDKKKQDEDDMKELEGISALAKGSTAPSPVTPRYTVLQSDMFRNIPESLAGSFDVILANPPYILPEEYHGQLPKSVKDWESEVALVGDGRHTGKNLLYFKELRDEAGKWLSPAPYTTDYTGPRMIFELGLQSKIMQKLFSEKSDVWPRVDLHLDRFEEPRWCECFFTQK